MRVLLIPELYPTTENSVAGIFINDYIRAIQKFAEVIVFNTNPFYRGAYQQEKGVEYYDFHLFSKKPPAILKPLMYGYWEKRTFELALKIPRVSLVHVHGSALRGAMALKLTKRLEIPLAVTEHTGPWSAITSRSSIFKRAKKVLKSADVVMPVSNHLKHEIVQSGVEMKRVEVLGNPVDENLYSLRRSALTNSRNIAFVGRLDEFKGAMRTLRAFDLIRKKYPNWKLTIAGSGAEASLIKTYISEQSLRSEVEFLEGVFTREELKNIYHSSSFLVFPSRFESFGLVAAEAIATGLPVLCTNQTGPLDYTNPKNSIQVSPDSVEQLAQGMENMINMLHQFQPLEVRKSLVNKFGIDPYALRLEAVYRSL